MWIGIVLIFMIPALSQDAFSQVQIRRGNQTLSITSGIAGGQPIPVINTTARIRYTQDRNNITKLTVQTVCPGQKFSLSVVAISPQQGVAAPEVTLTNGMLPVDFITDIPTGRRTRRATLQYTASATFAQGNSTELGDDVHTVTYTLVVQ